MKQVVLSLALLLAAGLTAGAQEDAAKVKAFEMPNPKHAEHGILASLAGDWELTMKMEAVPGVPGMEKPMVEKGTEHVEMVCNGLWLKSTINASFNGTPFTGVWLAGYDPFKKKFASYWVSSDENECELQVMDGTYDDKTKTFTWTCSMPQGDMRSVYVIKDADNIAETCFIKTPDGKEIQSMEFVRKRTKTAATKSAEKPSGKLSEEHLVLHKDLGTWDANVKSVAPGMPPSEDKGTETVKPICNGRWTWSDFTGSIMGGPYEGHAITGYSPAKKQYVSIWIDSMSPCAMMTAGDFNAAKKAYAMKGATVCPMGKPMTVALRHTQKDDGTRILDMDFKAEDMASKMEITYRRRVAK